MSTVVSSQLSTTQSISFVAAGSQRSQTIGILKRLFHVDVHISFLCYLFQEIDNVFHLHLNQNKKNIKQSFLNNTKRTNKKIQESTTQI